jgi:hypothetical protein
MSSDSTEMLRDISKNWQMGKGLLRVLGDVVSDSCTGTGKNFLKV